MSSPLPTQLREAAAGSRELDHKLLLHFGARHEKDWCNEYWFGEERCYDDRPTQSIDSALVLFGRVLPGWSVNLEIDFTREVIDPETDLDPCACSLFNHDGDHMKHVMEWAKSPALALCLALLSAVEGGEDHA